MAYGELRESLRFAAPLFALPAAVSLEPGVSAFSHGLSASNSYVFAWTDCCVEREATNRVDASVELFPNGDAVVRFGESVTNIVAALPEGYVGEGQDDDWARAAFSESDYAAITNKGYETWLMEDCVGINEQNGIYKISVTVDTVPTDGPFYLLCGPWKTVIKQPGTYSFPLHVRTDYTIRTFPTPVPLTFSRDHGYRCDDPDPYGYMMAAARRAAPPRPEQPIYNEREEPTLFATPHSIPIASAEDKELSMYFNDTGSRQYSYETNGDAILTFTGNKALIRRARVAQRVRIKLMQDGVTYDDEVELFDRYYPPWDGDHSSTNGTNESSSTNGTGNASSTNSNNSATSP